MDRPFFCTMDCEFCMSSDCQNRKGRIETTSTNGTGGADAIADRVRGILEPRRGSTLSNGVINEICGEILKFKF